jgi:hypothetical protein
MQPLYVFLDFGSQAACHCLVARQAVELPDKVVEFVAHNADFVQNCENVDDRNNILDGD